MTVTGIFPFEGGWETRSGGYPDKDLAALIAGMDASTDDKARILPFVKPGRILEVGCGGGAVLRLLSDAFPDSAISGVDCDPKMIQAATSRRYANDNVDVTRMSALDLGEDSAGLGFGWDTVVFCSCLHEAIEPSLSPAIRERVGLARLVSTARQLLAPGGRLIVRDGVRPKDRLVKIDFSTKEAHRAFFDFAAGYRPFRVEYSCNPGGGVIVDSWSAYEFLTKYLYADSDNWGHELGESYGWTRLAPLIRGLGSSGLGVVHAEAYTVPYLAERWAADVTLTGAYDGKPEAIDSTMIVVAEVQV